MMKEQIPIKLNIKYSDLVTNFKKEILELEGSLYGNFGDYVAEAMELYLNYMKNFPEKIGKEKHTISNLSKTQKRTNVFIEFAGDSLTPIRDNGIDHIGFRKLLKSCFNKSKKTLDEYERDILLNAGWSVINIPHCNKKIVIHRESNIYPYIERFDETLKNYYYKIKPNKEEQAIFSQLRNRLLPNSNLNQEADDIMEALK